MTPIPVQDLQANPIQPTVNAPAKEPQVDPNKSPEQINANPPAQAPAKENPPPVEDIVSRASQVGLEEGAPKGEPNQSDIVTDAGFNRNEWNSMLEKLPPEQRVQLESAYKSLQSGADKKFQKAADMLRQAQANDGQPWTLDKVAELTRDPSFVQAAQQYAQANNTTPNPQNSGLSDEDYSNLSENEKAKFQELTQSQKQLQTQLDNIQLSQQDEKLSTRYKNYDAKEVTVLRNNLMNGRVNATSEHLWKVLDYDDAVSRAYKLGLQDSKSEMGNKINATPVGGNGVNITPSGDVPVKEKGENTISFFSRIAQHNKAKLAEAQRK